MENIFLVIGGIILLFVVWKIFLLLLGKYLIDNVENLNIQLKFDAWKIVNVSYMSILQSNIYNETLSDRDKKDMIKYIHTLEKIVNSLNDYELEMLISFDIRTFGIGGSHTGFIEDSRENPFYQTQLLKKELYPENNNVYR